METFLTILEVLLPVVVALMGWGVKKLNDLINTKVASAGIAGILVRLNDAVFNVVRSVEQTVVSGIREASADGKITLDEQAKIKLMALNELKDYLGPKGIGEIAAILGFGSRPTTQQLRDVDRFLSSRIESSVHQMKQEAATHPPARAGVRPVSTSAP